MKAHQPLLQSYPLTASSNRQENDGADDEILWILRNLNTHQAISPELVRRTLLALEQIQRIDYHLRSKSEQWTILRQRESRG